MEKEILSILRHFIVVNMSYSLLSILIKRKALDKYISNALKQFKEQKFKYIISTNEINSCLFFYWTDTPEGFDFWCNIYEEYIRS